MLRHVFRQSQAALRSLPSTASSSAGTCVLAALAAGTVTATATLASVSFAQSAERTAPNSGDEGIKTKVSWDDGYIPTDKLTCKVSASKDTGTREGPYRPVVLVACGSFNPPHNLHMRMFEAAASALRAQGADVLGGYMSPVGDRYGKKGLAPAASRLAMCRSAAQDSDLVMVDGWEASQSGWVRTVKVLDHVAERVNAALGPQRGANVTAQLVCGSDLLESMCVPGVWNEPQLHELFGRHGVVCIVRKGCRVPSLMAKPDTILHKYQDKITLVREPVQNNMSSSKLRKELAAGRSVKFLMPPAVEAYIQQNGLYR